MKFLKLYKTDFIKNFKTLYNSFKLKEEVERHKKNFSLKDLKIILSASLFVVLKDFLVIDNSKNIALSILFFIVSMGFCIYKNRNEEKNKKYVDITKILLGMFIGSVLFLTFQLIFNILLFLYKTSPKTLLEVG